MPKIHAPANLKVAVSMSPRILCAAIVMLVAGSSAAAFAQSSDSSSATAMSMKASCRTDYRAHCTGNDPSAPIAAACLAQFYVNLSKSCQAALNAYNAPPGQAEEQ